MLWSKTSKRSGSAGFTIAEMLTVCGVSAVLCAVAIPQMISQRRLLRSSTVAREVMVHMRYTRQLALSRRAAFTIQYNNTTKQLKIIGPIPSGPAALADASYPNITGSTTLLTVPLAQSGLSPTELSEGIPTTSTGLPAGSPTIPTGALGDGISKSSLTSGILNITFQPDGSVIDATNAFSNKALFFFNNKAAAETATAISVIGASGRIKIWRYNSGANNYAE